MQEVVIGTFGGGTNGTAMYIEMIKRGEPPPLAILFADTGGEKPHTYEHISHFSKWLVAKGYPPIVTVRNEKITLEQSCLNLGTLPSVAFGWKTCSQRFKVEPQAKWIRNNLTVKRAWAEGKTITKLIGFDYGEERRIKLSNDVRIVNRFPLIEWEMNRDACVETVSTASLTLPGKSSCFFCPNSRRQEILELREKNPELYMRALNMEANALKATTVVGLGRNWSWADPDKIPPSSRDILCDCYDGDE